MANHSPGLRPPTMVERHYSWLYGFLPSALIYAVLVGVTYLLLRPDVNIFTYYLDFSQTQDPITGLDLPINFQMILARGFYLIAYFTWGRSTGHLVIGAHVVDRRTGRPMRTWQKLVRGSAQVFAGSLYIVLDGISLILILLDREERRSAYDWIAGTVVVVGDLPPEEEKAASRSWLGELAQAIRGKPAEERR